MLVYQLLFIEDYSFCYVYGFFSFHVIVVL